MRNIPAILAVWLASNGFVFGNPASQAAPQNSAATSADAATAGNVPTGPDAWRYRWHEGRWWYFTPSHRWLIWDGDQWNAYVAPPSTGLPIGNQPMRGYSRWGDWGQPRTNHGWVGGFYSSGGGYGSSDFGYGYGIPIPRGY